MSGTSIFLGREGLRGQVEAKGIHPRSDLLALLLRLAACCSLVARDICAMRDVIVPPAGVLTGAQIKHRLRYPHVNQSRRNVELAQQRRSNN